MEKESKKDSDEISVNLLSEIREGVKAKDKSTRIKSAVKLKEIVFKSKTLAESALPIIFKLLKDEEWEVHENACECLNEILYTYPEILKDEVSRIIWMIRDGGWFSQSWYSDFSRSLDDWVEVNEEGAKEALPALIELTEKGDSVVRRGAAIALGKIIKRNPEKMKEVLPTLMKLLNDDDESVRIYSALALRKAVKAIPEIVQEIEKHLKSEDEALFKSAIISLSDIIRNVGPQIIDPGIRKRLISTFISFLENRDVEVRKNVILALGDILEVETEVLEEVIPTLIERIEAKEWEERHSVSQVLRTRIRRNKKSMEKILPYLLEMGRKPSKEVRREIVVMLKEVVVKGGKPLEKSLPLLLELAKDKDPVVKFEAITTIEKIPPDHIKILKAYFPKLEQIMIENKNQKIRKIFSLIKEKIDENKI